MGFIYSLSFPLILQNYRMAELDDHKMLFDLIGKMLRYEPAERISLNEALRHPFFESVPPHHRSEMISSLIEREISHLEHLKCQFNKKSSKN